MFVCFVTSGAGRSLNNGLKGHFSGLRRALFWTEKAFHLNEKALFWTEMALFWTEKAFLLTKWALLWTEKAMLVTIRSLRALFFSPLWPPFFVNFMNDIIILICY